MALGDKGDKIIPSGAKVRISHSDTLDLNGRVGTWIPYREANPYIWTMKGSPVSPQAARDWYGVIIFNERDRIKVLAQLRLVVTPNDFFITGACMQQEEKICCLLRSTFVQVLAPPPPKGRRRGHRHKMRLPNYTSPLVGDEDE